jgi:hypothetical protein
MDEAAMAACGVTTGKACSWLSIRFGSIDFYLYRKHNNRREEDFAGRQAAGW